MVNSGIQRNCGASCCACKCCRRRTLGIQNAAFRARRCCRRRTPRTLNAPYCVHRYRHHRTLRSDNVSCCACKCWHHRTLRSDNVFFVLANAGTAALCAVITYLVVLANAGTTALCAVMTQFLMWTFLVNAPFHKMWRRRRMHFCNHCFHATNCTMAHGPSCAQLSYVSNKECFGVHGLQNTR